MTPSSDCLVGLIHPLTCNGSCVCGMMYSALQWPSDGGAMPSATWAMTVLRRGRPPSGSLRSLGSFPMTHIANSLYLYTSKHRSTMTSPSHLASFERSRDCLFNKHPSARKANSLETCTRIQVQRHQAITSLVHDTLPCQELHMLGEQDLFFPRTRFMGRLIFPTQLAIYPCRRG